MNMDDTVMPGHHTEAGCEGEINHPTLVPAHVGQGEEGWYRSEFGCVAWSLWLPSVTGVPMLCAVRPECSALLFYGYSHYFGPGTPTQDCASGDLCALALDRGFDTVLDLRSAFDDGKNRVLDCGEEAAGRRRSGSTQGDGRPGIALGSAFVSLELRPKT